MQYEVTNVKIKFLENMKMEIVNCDLSEQNLRFKRNIRVTSSKGNIWVVPLWL